MNKNNANISEIEDYFFLLLEGMDNVCFGTTPTPKADWKTMVLVDCAKTYNMGAYFYGNVLVYLYARPSDEEKDIYSLMALEEQLNEILDNPKEKGKYSIDISYKDSDYDNEKGMHYIVYSLNITIV